MREPDNSDYLELVVEKTKEFPKSYQKTIIFDHITPSSVIFSLYGIKIDQYIEDLMNFRAINQKAVADKITKDIFKDIFKPSAMPIFNFMIKVKKSYDRLKLEEEYGKSIPISDLFALNPDKDSNYYKSEIDGAIQINLIPEAVEKHKLQGYAFIEIKLFTAPIEDRKHNIVRHLRKQPLLDYFKLRHLFGLIGFSYLHCESNFDPIGKSDPRLKGMKNPYLWCIHFILMSKGILEDKINAIERAESILQAINKQQTQIMNKNYHQKRFKFGLTYNLVKVIKISQTISNLESKVEELKRKAKEQERKAKEQERKAKEQERKAKEQE
ncbi:MAG: hypothetical protein GF364_09295, partial [Candidatus Lokiarchaeota archaeon]|nr:hypothetical protein [Candidatus Lokiarchaeota archaeon]